MERRHSLLHTKNTIEKYEKAVELDKCKTAGLYSAITTELLRH